MAANPEGPRPPVRWPSVPTPPARVCSPPGPPRLGIARGESHGARASASGFLGQRRGSLRGPCIALARAGSAFTSRAESTSRRRWPWGLWRWSQVERLLRIPGSWAFLSQVGVGFGQIVRLLSFRYCRGVDSAGLQVPNQPCIPGRAPPAPSPLHVAGFGRLICFVLVFLQLCSRDNGPVIF